MKWTVLCVGFDHPSLNRIEDALRPDDCEVLDTHSFLQGEKLAAKRQLIAVLINPEMSGIPFETAIRQLKTAAPDTKVIAVTSQNHVGGETRRKWLAAGVHGLLSSPISSADLRVLLGLSADRRRRRTDKEALRGEARLVTDYVSAIIGESQPIRELRARIVQIGKVDRSLRNPRAVLITGETGTGKQLVARALHQVGDRPQGPFVEVNCSAIPSTLMEAELFGYEKGAFTDAKAAKPGLFEEADKGTLFLDEICSMDSAIQAKLLKVIEDKSVRRIGSTRHKRVDVRIIAASNWVGELALHGERIRPDLYYRLHAFSFSVPPLRERGNDVLLLANYVLRRMALEAGGHLKQIGKDTEAVLVRYPWPGNVRELIHVIERAAFLHDGDMLLPEMLELASDGPRLSRSVCVAGNGQVQVDFSSGGIDLEDVERQLISRALAQAKWNRTEAAALLGISKETLRYRIEKFGLHPPDPRSIAVPTQNTPSSSGLSGFLTN
ncbi:sigma-54-dependent transcriptional regulator [Petrachloros mirabilis]